MTGPHRAMRFGSMLAVTLCVGATAVSSPASAAAKEASPNQVLVTAAAAAARAGSVRVAAQFVSQGEVGNVVVDSAANAGQEALEIGKQLVSIVLVDGAVYISGNSQGLISYFGLPSSAAKTLSGRWISFNSSDTGYQTLVADVTLFIGAQGQDDPHGNSGEGKGYRPVRNARCRHRGEGPRRRDQDGPLPGAKGEQTSGGGGDLQRDGEAHRGRDHQVLAVGREGRPGRADGRHPGFHPQVGISDCGLTDASRRSFCRGGRRRDPAGEDDRSRLRATVPGMCPDWGLIGHHDLRYFYDCP